MLGPPTAGSSTLTSFSYGYTNPTTNKQTAIPYSVTDGSGNTTSYTYDSSNQLTQAIQKNSAGTQIASYSYTHDPTGNVTQQTLNGATTNMTYNAANELTQASGALNYTYAYDGNGDLTSRSDGLTISVNAADQVGRITPSGGGAINMSYMDVGESQRVTAGSNSYQYDATGMSMQTAGGGSSSFTTLPDGTLLSETVSRSTYYYLSDGAGNVAGLADPSALLADSYSYDPQGNITSKTEAVSNPFTYQGATYAYDGSSRLYYMGSCYYDSSVGVETGCKDSGWMDPGEDRCGEDEDPIKLNSTQISNARLICRIAKQANLSRARCRELVAAAYRESSLGTRNRGPDVYVCIYGGSCVVTHAVGLFMIIPQLHADMVAIGNKHGGWTTPMGQTYGILYGSFGYYEYWTKVNPHAPAGYAAAYYVEKSGALPSWYAAPMSFLPWGAIGGDC